MPLSQKHRPQELRPDTFGYELSKVGVLSPDLKLSDTVSNFFLDGAINQTLPRHEPSDAVATWQFLLPSIEPAHAPAAIVTETVRLLNEEFKKG